LVDRVGGADERERIADRRVVHDLEGALVEEAAVGLVLREHRRQRNQVRRLHGRGLDDSSGNVI
jgi:hypothetical protein